MYLLYFCQELDSNEKAFWILAHVCQMLPTCYSAFSFIQNMMNLSELSSLSSIPNDSRKLTSPISRNIFEKLYWQAYYLFGRNLHMTEEFAAHGRIGPQQGGEYKPSQVTNYMQKPAYQTVSCSNGNNLLRRNQQDIKPVIMCPNAQILQFPITTTA